MWLPELQAEEISMHVRIAPSPIHGRGVFANSFIKVGEQQFIYGDVRQLLPGDPIEGYGLEWDDGKTYIPFAPWCCVNHSDTPNCIVFESCESILMIETSDDIQINEELTINYGFSFDEWLAVYGFKGRYEVSSSGRIKSLQHKINRKNGTKQRIAGRILKQSVTNGYLSVRIANKTHYTHSLVARAFFGPRPKGFQVLHGPLGKLNNSVSNLRYGSPIENSHDWHIESDVWRSIRRSDGVEFPSVHEAARQTPRSDNAHIVHVAQGKRKIHVGFGWEYI